MTTTEVEFAQLDVVSDLDLRLVRYFVVVAEHSNFGRAAVDLRVAQPSLSRQIKRLESQLGARLFNRTSQGTQLSKAGRAFLPHAGSLLRAAAQATLTARTSAPSRSITIGYGEDFVITAAVKDLRLAHPEVEVRTRHLEWNDSTALTQGHVDAVIARLPLPFPSEHLRVTPLYDESRVLVVPNSHHLAEKASVAVSDFADEPFAPCAQNSAAWTTFWRLEPRVDGRPAPVGNVEIARFEDKLESIAQGLTVAVLPAGDRRIALREDLVSIPIDDVDPSQVVIVTRTGHNDQLLVDFLEAAQAHLSHNA
jgi:DNA-binding transcriptional LysR family regulator